MGGARKGTQLFRRFALHSRPPLRRTLIFFFRNQKRTQRRPSTLPWDWLSPLPYTLNENEIHILTQRILAQRAATWQSIQTFHLNSNVLLDQGKTKTSVLDS